VLLPLLLTALPLLQIVYYLGPVGGDKTCSPTCANYETVLFMWMIGSLGFTCGGFALAYRHFVMGVA